MMKSPMMRYVGMAAWVLTALAALNLGLAAFIGWDFFQTDFVMINMPMIVRPLLLLIGLAGLASLIMFVMAVSCKDGACGSCKK